jgi:glycosyltransferase involved in cell wall biosynthesis
VRIVFLTQVVDADHPALAQTIDKIRALAERFDGVSVLCDHVGRHDLPPHVELRTFGARTRVGRGARFEVALARELTGDRGPVAVLSHMIPSFLVLAAPAARLRRAPLLLWYTHWHASRSLRLATRLADTVLSVDTRSFPLASPKVRGIGHAIDVELFRPATGPREDAPLRLLALGRTARWKGYETMLAALETAVAEGLDAELEIRGPQLTDDERAHRRELEAAVAGSEILRRRVRIEPPVPRDELPFRFVQADALLSATQPRASLTLDKVVYEAAASGLPVVASNPGLEEFLAGLPLELRFPGRDAGALAERLLALGAASPDERAATGVELRRRVVEGHSLASWADGVTAALARQAAE